jgi:hypothetical protein
VVGNPAEVSLRLEDVESARDTAEVELEKSLLLVDAGRDMRLLNILPMGCSFILKRSALFYCLRAPLIDKRETLKVACSL